MMAIQSAAAGHVGLARLEPTDGDALRRLFFQLSPETIYRRFLSPLARPEQARPERLLDVDHHDREAVVAVVDGEIVGVARYFRSPDTEIAELAVVVADPWQRQGLATRMLGSLCELALAAGIRRFAVTIQADNRPALNLLKHLGPATGLALSQGVYEATFPINPASAPR
jgi:RimJ/RimL family protein N-acetyltransferase